MAELKREYGIVFADELGLPPRRECDHAICLQTGATPPNVRLYRYPHVQKSEIEKLVRDMAATGIIEPSQSPYSNPVLLVKEKDGGW